MPPLPRSESENFIWFGQVGEDPLKVSTQPLRDVSPPQDANMRDQMQGMRLALTNALKELLQVSKV